ncbi:MAG TPA: YHS domain-containing protein [Candidatus Sulfotelmatobacter sp.]|nr:YHS domain-containing protein [Candidatus Sulfotelmatobacter sp.]
MKKKFTHLIGMCLLACGMARAQDQPPAAPPFAHPGLLHTRSDLERMRQRVAAGEEPWKSGFQMLRRDQASRADWSLRGPFEVVTCVPGASRGESQMAWDSNAAYQNALLWCITGEDVYARKAVAILNAWAGTLRQMEGRDVQLRAGLNGFKLVNAAELMRPTYPAWKPEEVAQFERMLKGVILPRIRDFAPFANGNWDAACLKTLLAIGVFCEDRELFNRAVDYFRHGQGNGCLTNYVINASGQCQESGRDQQHAQLGLGLLAEACEIAWHQGVDLYSEADNRLLKGFEYTAKYNLGEEVPFVPHIDTTGKYRHKSLSPEGRGRLRPIYEMVWNHYQVRCGVPAPFTEQAADKLRPEGAAWAGDHPGFGTLLFSLPAKASPPPAAKPEARDPVCGMTVNEAKAKAAGRFSEYAGKPYFFCNPGCKEEFDAHPAQYVGNIPPPGTSPTDPVCAMTVNEAEARAADRVTSYGGQSYYFCSDRCKGAFAADPEKYLKPVAASLTNGMMPRVTAPALTNTASHRD